MPGFRGRGYQPAQEPGGSTGVPNVQHKDVLSTETFVEGALVIYGAGANDHLIVEAGATPVAAVGVSLAPANKGPGFDIGDSPTVVTGRQGTTPIALFKDGTRFSMRGVNGGTDPVTPALTHVGQRYGAIKTADGSWALNEADTTNDAWEVEKVLIKDKIFLCKWIGTILA